VHKGGGGGWDWVGYLRVVTSGRGEKKTEPERFRREDSSGRHPRRVNVHAPKQDAKRKEQQ